MRALRSRDSVVSDITSANFLPHPRRTLNRLRINYRYIHGCVIDVYKSDVLNQLHTESLLKVEGGKQRSIF